MNRRFQRSIEALDASLKELKTRAAVSIPSLPPVMPKSGVYLFTEDKKHLYVGRSNDLKGRIRRHARPSSRQSSATFAFKLAREATGETTASYNKKGSREALMKKPAFRRAFEAAKERIRGMDVRWVEEPNQLRQALLEIYAAVAFKTPYNDFKTH